MEFEPELKKIKVEANASMDIAVRFPIEISEMIFEFLPAKDLLEASLVNQKWYKIIGHTKKCMKKINLKNFCLWVNEEQILPDSTRMYQNIEIKYIKIDHNLEAFFKKNENNWKRVYFWSTEFELPSLWNILETLAPSLEVLKLKYIGINQLMMPNTNPTIIYPKLKMLEVSDDRDSQKVSSFVRQILNFSPQFNIIKFEGLETVFDESFPMTNFLKKQIDGLQLLEVGMLQSDCLELVLRMPKLKAFKCKNLDSNWKGTKLPQNNSIEYFHFLNEDRDEIIRAVVEKLPNLKGLTINNLNDEIYTIVPALNLKYLKCRRASISAHLVLSDNTFPKLKVFKAERLGGENDHFRQVRNAKPTSNFHSLYMECFDCLHHSALDELDNEYYYACTHCWDLSCSSYD